ncbi:hypothetical protein MNBD_NITROSPINAE01-733 [hydrothermal vent metagenome]|uniref:Methyltransferase type 11 domain-containing protein n=1 Tax=hydrothermal vent metagenome TaxID=652676 RepID=A0A3B1CF94_9ZZZZ
MPDLDRIVFYGRTLDEYRRFFALDPDSLKGAAVLDCPAGASSFTAEAFAMGIHAVAFDAMYGPNLKAMMDSGLEDIDHVVDAVAKEKQKYIWDYYHDLDGLKKQRAEALQKFSEDYPGGAMENRYFSGRLPVLPFEDEVFDLVLSGHFLFCYSDRLDYAFHKAAILEMLRVTSGEVRIYPLTTLTLEPCGFVNDIIADLDKNKITAEIAPVPFEFVKGANQMLRVYRK